MNFDGPVAQYIKKIRKNKDFNFKFLGLYDISFLKKTIGSIPETDWNKNTIRQEVFDAHKDTRYIPVLFDVEYENRMGEKTEYYSIFENEVKKIESTVNNLISIPGTIIRFEIVKMLAKTKIPEHIDNSPSLLVHSRFHIPIQTKDNVFFTINDETKNLKEGEIWEINNTEKHSVVNDSDLDRIHIIFDWKEIPKNIL